VEDPSLLVAALALLAYALLSRRLDRWWISMPAAMVALGLLAGPLGLRLIASDVEGEVVRSAAETTLALMLFHDAVRIDLRALRRNYEVPLRLLGIGLPLMILIGTVLACVILPTLGLVGAALVATMLAPTDAALGEAVVSDERVPIRIRQGLNVESGLNDGLSVPVFLVLLAMAAEPNGVQSGAFLAELAAQIGFGMLGGLIVGGAGGLLFRLAALRKFMEPTFRRIAIVSIALGCFLAAAVMGGSGFIGAFTGGILFGVASEARSSEDNSFTAYLGTVFDAVSFFLLGAAVLPFALRYLSWQSVLYVVASLVVVRMVCVVVAMLRSGARRPTLAFMGWFGPRGLATLVFAVLVLDESIPNGAVIASTAALGVTLSVLAHGFSAPPLVTAYADWWKRSPRSGALPMEETVVHEHTPRLARRAAGPPAEAN
jgi:NhaP-type Na+/H+ or K+/H+ antiporter